MDNQTDNRLGSVPGNRKALMLFLGFLAICGCFFVAGYVLGNRTDPPPLDYADAGIAGNSENGYGSDDEYYYRAEKIADEPVSPPSDAVAEPKSAEVKAVVSSGEVSAVSIPAITPDAARSSVADKPNPPAKKTQPGKTAETSAGKTNASVKPATAMKTVYSVQIAAFRALRQAEAKEAEIKAEGFAPWIEPPQKSGDYYRVRVGRFNTRAEAGKMESRLKKSGFDTMVTEVKTN